MVKGFVFWIYRISIDQLIRWKEILATGSKLTGDFTMTGHMLCFKLFVIDIRESNLMKVPT